MDGRAEVFVMMMDGRWAVARGRMEVQAGGGTTMLSLLYAYSGRFVCRVCCVLCGVCCVVCRVCCEMHICEMHVYKYPQARTF